MGWYIQTATSKGKAEIIASRNNGEIVGKDRAAEAMNTGSHDVVAVVDNGPFEAAAFCYSLAEFQAFSDPSDPRPVEYVLLPKGIGAKLSGYSDEGNDDE